MKSLLLLLWMITVAVSLQAQPDKPKQKKDKHEKTTNTTGKGKEGTNKIGNSGKEKQEKEQQIKKHEDIIWDGTNDKGKKGPHLSKNQPAPVRKAFQRDYPNAVNVRWSKYRGDWTATFANGLLTSTAVYHANGDLRDTRTPIPRSDLPGTIDDIFRKNPRMTVEDIIRINLPQQVRDIFRIKTTTDGIPKFRFYAADGREITYDY